MKKTIDGMRYDTDKAEKLATYSSPHYSSDFHSYQEALYRTPKGNLFLCGEGNGLSKYGSVYADGSGSGVGLTPMTEREAIEWLAGTDNEDVIDEHFSEAVEEA